MFYDGLPMKGYNIIYIYIYIYIYKYIYKSSHYSDHCQKNIIIYKYLIFFIQEACMCTVFQNSIPEYL